MQHPDHFSHALFCHVMSYHIYGIMYLFCVTGVRTLEVPTPPFFTFHHVNAFETDGPFTSPAPSSSAPSSSLPRYLILDSVSAR